MKEIIMNTVKLCIITLIAGILLGTVYEVTSEPRKKQQEKTKQEAYAKVFKDASTFETYDYDKKALTAFLADKGYKKSVALVDEIVEADSATGEMLGYVLTVTDKEGYGGEIRFTIGIRKDGIINGISFLTINETAGVGMKAKEGKFKNQFAGMTAKEISYTKTPKTSEDQIDAISGATVTTNAVTNGVNCAIEAYQFITGEEAQKNE